MGYYSTLKEPEGKITKVNREALESLNKKLESEELEGFEEMEIEIDNKGYVNIEAADFVRKFDDTEEFLNEFAKVVEEGHVVFTFVGDDGGISSFIVKNGKVENGLYMIIPESLLSEIQPIIDRYYQEERKN